MQGIGDFFSNIFSGRGGGFQPTDINPAPTTTPGVSGVWNENSGIPSAVSATATGGGGSSPLWMKLLTAGMFGSGELGNLLQSNKQNNYQNLLLKYAQNPALLTQAVNSATKPLDNALVQAVNNQVQANAASRGLAQAPGIFNAEEAQALAPYVQQEQNLAQNQVLASLGLPGQVTNINQRPADLSSSLAMFLRAMGQNPFSNLSGVNTPTGVPQQTPTNPGITFPSTSTFPNINFGSSQPNLFGDFDTGESGNWATGFGVQ